MGLAATFAGAAVVMAAMTSAVAAPARDAGAPGQPQTSEPRNPGRQVDPAAAKTTFQTLCSRCHDLGIVTAQRHDRAGWNDIIQRMYGFNFVASEEEADEVLEYLVKNYPPRS